MIQTCGRAGGCGDSPPRTPGGDVSALMPSSARTGTLLTTQRVARLWREEGLKVPVRVRRKRAGTNTG